MVFLGALAKSRARIAGLPTRLTDTLARTSVSPDRVIARASSKTLPVTSPHAYGSAAVTSASLPKRPNVYPAASGTP